MLMHYSIVLLALIIEAIVDQLWVVCPHYHHSAVAPATRLGPPLFTALLLSLHHIEVIDSLKLKDLSLLTVPE